MSTDERLINPVVRAVLEGTAPRPARLAAARGMLPLAQEEMVEVLVALRAGADEEVARAAAETLDEQDTSSLAGLASSPETSPAVLGYLAGRAGLGREAHEAVALNPRTPDEAVAALASATPEGSVLEVIAINQQRLIRAPLIIDAVLRNPARTPEAERRVRETRAEFFEKERGAQQIADEMRARGMTAAAEFVEASESVGAGGVLTPDDAWLIAQHIEVSDADIDDSWLPAGLLDELIEETDEQRRANVERILSETAASAEAGEPERISLIRRIMFMKVKDRIKLAMKGDREARNILIRDANKTVSTAVVHNPKLSDQEVEAIAAMRTVSDEVLRLIALNRAWARQYPVIHNLARNPRTPLPTAMSILPRIQTRDLKSLSQNRNVSEAVRRQALRLSSARTGQ